MCIYIYIYIYVCVCVCIKRISKTQVCLITQADRNGGNSY